MAIQTEETLYFTLKGNPEYRISSKLEVIEIKRNRIVSSSENKTFNTSLFGMPIKQYDKEFLFKLSSTRVFIHPLFPDHVNYLKFLNNLQPNSSQHYIAVFTKPQIYKNDYLIRFVPGVSFLACKPDGTVYEVTDNGELRLLTINKASRYPVVYSKSMTFLVHKLVALTWCFNKDDCDLIQVEHKDSNNFNSSSSNLRWISSKSSREFIRVRPSDSLKESCKCKNIYTGEVKVFESKNALSDYIGRSKISNTNIELRPGKLWRGDNGVFEVKLCSDETDWVYYDIPEGFEFRSSTDMPNNPLKQSMTSIKIVMPDSRVLVFNNFEDLFKHLLKGVPCDFTNIKKYKDLLFERYPNIRIEIDRQRGYEAKNYHTDEIVEGQSLSTIAIKIGTNKSMATKYCKLGRILNGWLIRVKNSYMDIPWPDIKEELPSNTTIQYEVINTDTGEKARVESKRKLSLFMGVDRKYISKLLLESDVEGYSTWKNFKFKEISRTRQDLSTDNKRSFKEGKFAKVKY